MKNYYHLSKSVIWGANVIHQEEPLVSKSTGKRLSRPIAVVFRPDGSIYHVYTISWLSNLIKRYPDSLKDLEGYYTVIYAYL